MEQIAVQVGHACFEAGRHFSQPGDIHPNFVICGVPDESTLLQEYLKIRGLGICAKMFLESDIGQQFTALATEPVSADQRRYFRFYKLYKSKTRQS
jgi:hypothetical protein